MTRAWAHAPNPASPDGGDVQCHFVPGVAASSTPSVFDPYLLRSRRRRRRLVCRAPKRIIPHSSGRAVSPSRPAAGINDR